MSSNFQIRLLTTELAALERLKHQCFHFFSVGIDPILFKVGGYIDMHNILHEFEFWPNGTPDYGVSCPWASKKLMSPRFLGCFSGTFRLLTLWSLLALKKTIALLLENYSNYFNDFTWWLSGELSLPFGLLVLVYNIYCLAINQRKQQTTMLIMRINLISMAKHLFPFTYCIYYRYPG